MKKSSSGSQKGNENHHNYKKITSFNTNESGLLQSQNSNPCLDSQVSNSYQHTNFNSVNNSGFIQASQLMSSASINNTRFN